MKSRLQKLRLPLIPKRVRRIAGKGFAFIPHRFLADNFLSLLSRDELALYVFLLLAGNQHGVSFYRYDAICSTLSMHLDDYIQARNALIAKDLLAFDGQRYQVLSLPAQPPVDSATPLTDQADFEAQDPATIRAAILADLDSAD
jgi:hypothetical protein